MKTLAGDVFFVTLLLALAKRGEFAVEFGDRESHDVVKASLDSFYADVSHPVLYSV